MKKLLLVFFTINCFAQAPAIEWQKKYGGSGNDTAASIKQTTDGGYILTGTTSSNDIDITNNHGGFDYSVIKITNNGLIEWKKTLGGSLNDFPQDIIQTNDSGFIVVGYSSSSDFDLSSNSGEEDIWIVKMNNTGVVEWKKTIGGSFYDLGMKIYQTADNGYIIGGNSRSQDGDIIPSHIEGDFLVLKLSESGDIVWQNSFGGSSHDYLANIEKTIDGGYLLCGHTSSTDGDVQQNNGLHDYWIVKISDNGNLIWEKAYGGSQTDVALDAKELNDGTIMVIGYSFSNDGQITNSHGGCELWMVKLDSLGNMIWQKSIGGSKSDNGVKIITNNSDSSFIVLGATNSTDGNVTAIVHPSYYFAHDSWIFKSDFNGNILWQKTIGGSGSDGFSTMEPTADGGYILIGQTDSNDGDVTIQNYGSADFWVLKLSSEQLSSKTFENETFLIYPNPTTNMIYIQTPNGTLIDKFIITDLLGKEIISQINTNQVSTEILSNGIYLVQIFSGDAKYQSKFIKQ